MDYERIGTPTGYGDRVYHSRTEAFYAAYFDQVGMYAIPQPAKFVITEDDTIFWASMNLPEYSSGLTATVYTPDFYLPEQDTYVEVKNGYEVEWGAGKIALLAFATGSNGLLINGLIPAADWFWFSPNRQRLGSNNTYGASMEWIGRRHIGPLNPFTIQEYLTIMLDCTKQAHAQITSGFYSVEQLQKFRQVKAENSANPVTIKLD